MEAILRNTARLHKVTGCDEDHVGALTSKATGGSGTRHNVTSTLNLITLPDSAEMSFVSEEETKRSGNKS